MTDIGKGDVVEAIKEMHVQGLYTGRGPYSVMAGTRAIVAGVMAARSSICPECGDQVGPGLILEELPLIQGVAWCLCEWRKIGGSREDTVRPFRAYLQERAIVDPEVMKRLFAPPGRSP